MPRIFDNINEYLVNALNDSLNLSHRADFCVGYFNLRGWKEIDAQIDKFAGAEKSSCRLLVGMSISPEEELRSFLNCMDDGRIEQSKIVQLKKKIVSNFKEQLCYGIPTTEDEIGLHRLVQQLKSHKLIVKLYLRSPLHAKLYLAYRNDPINPIIGFLGSSNLTFAGLAKQGELNIDVLDKDAAEKLSSWFDDRWNDRFAIDITEELIQIIEESWARQDPIPPYHIYLKIAYTLSQEARTGISEEILSEKFETRLFPFQKEAVKIAAHHIRKRGGAIIGDVVGLGKTITATALASLFQDDWRILIICPKNLKEMWKDYGYEYGVQMEIMSITEAERLSNAKRYHLVIIDESHNLRNKEGKRYQLVKEYIANNSSKVVLLSATPYNKTYIDLANQLQLFIDENEDIGIAPETFIKEKGELELSRRECLPRTLKAFEYSEYADDWRELMRLYLVRRTRGFVKDNYAKLDESNGRKYLLFSNGKRSYFPDRIPKTLIFASEENNPSDQYAKLYSDKIVKDITKLILPRYGLGNYIKPERSEPPTSDEANIIKNLSRAGNRLMGFCRTGLFKRLESCGSVFLKSIERHILRNYIFIYALQNKLPLPIGAQDIELLEARIAENDDDFELNNEEIIRTSLNNQHDFLERAEEVYRFYEETGNKRFKWLHAHHFIAPLVEDLEKDSKTLISILRKNGTWNFEGDTKLKKLHELVSKTHSQEKVLIFTQFADTAKYLAAQLKYFGVDSVDSVTGDNENPTLYAQRFSPISNNKIKEFPSEKQLRVLIATDVLSEGQNLQDAHIVVNYDLPWAIIRLIQRAGRVDRIGQNSTSIICYSFMPVDGVEKIINLRQRVKQRLTENSEVVGSDEKFFEDQEPPDVLRNLYHEKSGILDGDTDTEVDLSSEAYQIWKSAIDKNPELEKIIPDLPNVVFSSRPWPQSIDLPDGVLVFVKTAYENSALAWLDNNGKSVTESQWRILKAAKCTPDTPTAPRAENHHELVKKGVELISKETRATAGTLGNQRGARFRIYEKLKHFVDSEDNLFITPEARKALQLIYDSPLTNKAKDLLNQHFKGQSSEETLISVITSLYEDNELCVNHDETETHEPKLICSLGFRKM